MHLDSVRYVDARLQVGILVHMHSYVSCRLWSWWCVHLDGAWLCNPALLHIRAS